MNEQVQGLIRHALTLIGGVAIYKGWIEESVVAEWTGIIMSVVGTIWSIASKSK